MAVDSDDLVICWLNSHSSLMIKSHGATIIFDPVLIDYNELKGADAIVVTHEHWDHFERSLIEKCQKMLNLPVYTTPYIAQMLPSKAQELVVGDSVSIGDIVLVAEQCDHPGKEPLSFVISARNSATIYHPSDSRAFNDMEGLRDGYETDILLFSGTSISDAMDILNLVEPRVVITYYSDRIWAENFLLQTKATMPRVRVNVLGLLELWSWNTGC
ncbi:MBL fold metallo-hydrolase [Chloroflexota bacterium]